MPDDGEQSGGSASAFWSGTITFGLVTVPVQLIPAVRLGGFRWRMLAEDGTPLRRRYICPKEEREVTSDEIERGFKVDEERYVLITDEELEALEPRKSRDIDLREFVDQDEIDPLFFDRAYYLTPAGESNKAYRLLAEVMEKSRRAGIATFVMREKEYLIAIVASHGILRAVTLRFHDEVRQPADVGLDIPRAPSRQAVERIIAQIDKQRDERIKPSWLSNDYAARMQKVLEKKRRDHQDTIKVKLAEQDSEEGGDDDIMAALQRSLSPVKPRSPQSSKRKPSRRTKSVKSGSRPSRARKSA